MRPERKLAIPGSSSDQPMLSRSEVEALMEREAQPESPVLSVYLDTNQADAINVSRGW